MKTVQQKLDQLKLFVEAEKIAGTNELGRWEQGFLESVCEQVLVRGINSLSDKQLKKIHDIYDRI
jgi:hypothetical protein